MMRHHHLGTPPLYKVRKLGAKQRRQRREALRERDGDLCWLCSEPMLFDIDPADERAPTLEHVTRRADGGDNSLVNLRLTHRECNNRRG